jgi:hypothetical protein
MIAIDDAIPSDTFPIRLSEAATAMAPAVAAMARQFNASVTVLNAFHFAPDYVVSPRFDAASCSEPIAIPYIPAALELRNQREQRLEEFVREQLASIEWNRMGRKARAIRSHHDAHQGPGPISSAASRFSDGEGPA